MAVLIYDTKDLQRQFAVEILMASVLQNYTSFQEQNNSWGNHCCFMEYQCCFKGCLSFSMKHPILCHVICLTFITGIFVCFSLYHLNYRIFSQFVLFIFVKPFFQTPFYWNFYILAVVGSDLLDSSLIVFCSIAVSFIVQQYSPGVLQSFR